MPTPVFTERRQSGNIAGQEITKKWIVQGGTTQEQIYGITFDNAPLIWLGLHRGEIAVEELVVGLYYVTVPYKSETNTPSPSESGQPPAGGKESQGDHKSGEAISRDMTFTTGGGTQRIYISRKTIESRGVGDKKAPSFGQLIGVSQGKIEGCEVFSASADFSITKRFAQVTFGWFRTMLSNVATTNNAPFLGMSRDEVLFKGCDGNYKEMEKAPWTITGRFGFSPHRQGDTAVKAGGIEFDFVSGWEYVWFAYGADTDVTTEGVTYPVHKPKWGYREQVYGVSNFGDLGFE